MIKRGMTGDMMLVALLGTTANLVGVAFSGQLKLSPHVVLLGTDLWLWLSFFRTGRADVFRIAHALTRHLSETDTHHTGPFAGLGSRHNVSHWGDGAKEARITGSWLRRPFYYITSTPLVIVTRWRESTDFILFSGRVNGRYYGSDASG
jgi:hypothetical protein